MIQNSPYPDVTDRKQHEERSKLAWGAALKEGEQRMMVVPAYDYMKSEKDSGYGRHSAELIFVERRKGLVIDVRFFTGWDINYTPSHHEFTPYMCTGYYYHYDDKKEASEYAHHTTECQLSGGECYGEAGSALHGDDLFHMLINEGSPAIWADIDKEFKNYGR